MSPHNTTITNTTHEATSNNTRREKTEKSRERNRGKDVHGNLRHGFANVGMNFNLGNRARDKLMPFARCCCAVELFFCVVNTFSTPTRINGPPTSSTSSMSTYLRCLCVCVYVFFFCESKTVVVHRRIVTFIPILFETLGYVVYYVLEATLCNNQIRAQFIRSPCIKRFVCVLRSVCINTNKKPCAAPNRYEEILNVYTINDHIHTSAHKYIPEHCSS